VGAHHWAIVSFCYWLAANFVPVGSSVSRYSERDRLQFGKKKKSIHGLMYNPFLNYQ